MPAVVLKVDIDTLRGTQEGVPALLRLFERHAVRGTFLFSLGPDHTGLESKSKLPQYAYSKRIIFLDKEAFLIPYTDIYDQAGELWKAWVNLFRIGKQPFDGAPPEGVYPDDMPWAPSIFMVDMQLDHATRAALPSTRFAREVGWSYNKNVATEDFFTIAALISSGR